MSLVEEYLDAIAPKYRAATLVSYARDLGQLAYWMDADEAPDTWPEDVTPALFDAWCGARGFSLGSRRRKLSTARGFLDWCRGRKVVAVNRLARHKVLYAPPRRNVFPEESEVARLLGVFATYEDGTPLGNARMARDEALLRLMTGAGVRIGEALAMTVSDLTVSPGSARISTTGGGRTVPILAEDLPAVERYARKERRRMRPKCDALFVGKDGLPMSRQAANLRLQQHARAAGVGALTSRALRLLFARRMVEQRHATHAELKAVLGYANDAPVAALTDALRDLAPVPDPSFKTPGFAEGAIRRRR